MIAWTVWMADFTAATSVLAFITGRAMSSAQASGPLSPLNSANGGTFGAKERTCLANSA
jgi:hypothetical protein